MTVFLPFSPLKSPIFRTRRHHSHSLWAGHLYDPPPAATPLPPTSSPRRSETRQGPNLKMVFVPSKKKTSHTRSRWSKGRVYDKMVMNQCEQYMVGYTPSSFRCAPSFGACPQHTVIKAREGNERALHIRHPLNCAYLCRVVGFTSSLEAQYSTMRATDAACTTCFSFLFQTSYASVHAWAFVLSSAWPFDPVDSCEPAVPAKPPTRIRSPANPVCSQTSLLLSAPCTLTPTCICIEREDEHKCEVRVQLVLYKESEVRAEGNELAQGSSMYFAGMEGSV